MSTIPLFCIAEEAKPYIHKVLTAETDPEIGQTDRIQCLVESRICPSHPSQFKQVLEEGEDFELAFIGASVEECQAWAREQTNPWLDKIIITIADARTAQDTTISAYVYKGDIQFDVEGYGMLPPRINSWYEYRIEYKWLFWFSVHFEFLPPDYVMAAYIGRKGEFMDERGVMDVERIRRVIREEEP